MDECLYYLIPKKTYQMKNNSRKDGKSLPSIKICFFALNSYPVFSGKYEDRPGEIGGAELQQSVIGRELVKKRYEISFIVFNNDNPSCERIHGVTFYKTIEKGYRFSGPLSYIIALKSIWNSLASADADIYYQRGADPLTGILSIFCIAKRRKFIFALANDMDINGEFSRNFRWYSKLLYYFGLKTADKILVQTEYQKDLLKSLHARDGFLIKNIFLLESADLHPMKRPVVLWVGTIRPWKQPELFLKLARVLPQVQFRMIGGAAKNYVGGGTGTE